MSRIALDCRVEEELARWLAGRLGEQFDIDVSRFEAQELLDGIGERLGAHYYNQGLMDAQALVRGKVDDVLEAIHGLEKPVG